MNDNNFIATCDCDLCGNKSPGVVFHDGWNVPVLFECRSCSPQKFETVARGDIQKWLDGGTRSRFGR